MPGLDPFKTEQQPFEFVLPGERSLYGQALLMNGLVEETFSASLGFFTVSRVLRNVGNHASVEYAFPVFFESNPPSKLINEPFNEMPTLRVIRDRCSKLSGKRIQSFRFAGAMV